MAPKAKNSSAPLLLEKHLSNCKLVSQRFHLLDKVIPGGIGAEIGVLGGDWSERLIRFTKPKKLVLIDTFKSNDYPHLKRFTRKTHYDYIKK